MISRLGTAGFGCIALHWKLSWDAGASGSSHWVEKIWHSLELRSQRRTIQSTKWDGQIFERDKVPAWRYTIPKALSLIALHFSTIRIEIGSGSSTASNRKESNIPSFPLYYPLHQHIRATSALRYPGQRDCAPRPYLGKVFQDLASSLYDLDGYTRASLLTIS